MVCFRRLDRNGDVKILMAISAKFCITFSGDDIFCEHLSENKLAALIKINWVAIVVPGRSCDACVLSGLICLCDRVWRPSRPSRSPSARPRPQRQDLTSA